MNKQYFLQKAHKARPDLVKDSWLWSIKLDGIRALWDGGVSRGRTDAPWAPGVKATGLWTINAKVIHAPEWWLNTMPNFICDGELWAGPGNFQFVSSVVRRKIPDDRWAKIRFMHHTEITVEDFCTPRVVDEPHCKLIMEPGFEDYFSIPSMQPREHGAFYEQLPWHEVPRTNTWEAINAVLDELVMNRHEGIMLRPSISRYSTERSWELLKLKPFKDADVTVIGVVAGAETDKGSRLLGRMGSLVCRWRNNTFHVSGFRDVQRDLVSQLSEVNPVDYASDHAGEELPPFIQSKDFPNGTRITIKYRELTTYREVPKDPRFWRVP